MKITYTSFSEMALLKRLVTFGLNFSLFYECTLYLYYIQHADMKTYLSNYVNGKKESKLIFQIL